MKSSRKAGQKKPVQRNARAEAAAPDSSNDDLLLLAEQLIKADQKRDQWTVMTFKASKPGREVAAFKPERAKQFLMVLVELGMSGKKTGREATTIEETCDLLLRRKLPIDAQELELLLEFWCCRGWRGWGAFPAGPIKVAEQFDASDELNDTHRALLQQISVRLDDPRVGGAEARKVQARILTLVNAELEVPLGAGEAWSDDAIAVLQAMLPEERSAWAGLMTHCGSASTGKPSAKWSKAAAELMAPVQGRFAELLTRWLLLVDKPRTAPAEPDIWGGSTELLLDELNAGVLKGLLWCTALLDQEEPDLARAIGMACISAYKKVPNIGPRSVKVGNACVWALGELRGMHGVGQLALLRVRVRFQTAQKGIVKALEATAERVGISAEELEEMGIPTYGLDEVGLRREVMGDFTANLAVTSTTTTTLTWTRADGKEQKSVPQAVKDSFDDELKDLKAAAKDIQRMLPAQRDRIDGLFLAQRRWPIAKWRERYLDHPLVGTLARRILWTFHSGKVSCTGIYRDGRFVDSSDEPLPDLGDDCEVTLWHPIDASADAVTAWRDWFARHEVRQPFKQAHREIYLLTDAERRTDVYSNRFAAHILKQHQFHALCGVRGWRNRLRMAVDDEYEAPCLWLPQWSLRAEYWVESVGEEWNDAGVYFYIATDQVRFYDIDAQQRSAHAGGGGYRSYGPEEEPRKLETIPPIVLSEVLRDVDLFVGVASLGNDPNWMDGGSEGMHRDYWSEYAFGKLSETAKTRRAVLQDLVPRLKIAEQCSFDDKFLVVRGTRRTYRIHLGSGNILMEPNDQYLCIVPDSRAKATGDRVFLPFEGDRTLSLILSKAMLLAADDKIQDATILTQIAEG